MYELPNITGNIAKLREKQSNVVFGQSQKPKWRKPPAEQTKLNPSLRSSMLSWLAIGVIAALFFFQVAAANLFNIIR